MPSRRSHASIVTRDRERSSGGANTPPMDAARIQARAVAKIAIVALAMVAVALLLALVVLHTRTTLQWVVIAVFLALGDGPARGARRAAPHPRPWRCRAGSSILVVYLVGFLVFVFVLLQVIPPIVKEVEKLAKTPDLHLRLRGLGRAERGVPQAQRQVRHHQDAHRGGQGAALEARRRGERGRRADRPGGAATSSPRSRSSRSPSSSSWTAGGST